MGDLLLAGYVGKPHGIAGEVYVVRISDDPRRFEAGATLIHADGRKLTIVSCRPHQDRFLVRFEGVDTRDDAGHLRGALYVGPDDRRELDRDEFWPDDLVGCVVVDGEGNELGRVTDVTGNAAQDILIVDGAIYVPMVKEIVISVDLEDSTIQIDPPEGLFS